MSYEDTTHISSVDPTYELQPQTFEELRSWLEQYCRGEKNHGEPNTWDVTLVMDMSELFRELETFNAPIDRWDTSNVTNMKEMFAVATSFNQPLTLDTSRQLCVVCYTNCVDTVMVPCGHACMCHGCAKRVKETSGKCPICRRLIENINTIIPHIYYAGIPRE